MTTLRALNDGVVMMGQINIYIKTCRNYHDELYGQTKAKTTVSPLERERFFYFSQKFISSGDGFFFSFSKTENENETFSLFQDYFDKN